MNELLDYALRYAALNWHVFPLHSARDNKCTCGNACSSPAKHPMISGGLYAATTDPDQIADWWRRWPYANVGVATGIVSGFFVLDVDTRHGGDETLQCYIDQYGYMEQTALAHTGGGGLHIICKYPGTQVRNKVSVGPGLDIRGDGGYIVAPPSLHISGKYYEWEIPPWA